MEGGANKMKELSEKIPAISFVMMCEVMLYHCESPSSEFAVNATDLWWNQLITDIVTGHFAMLCMSWFFAITAFLLFRNLSFQNMGSKLLSRVKTLLVPYLLWQVIYIIKAYFQGNPWTFKRIITHVFLLRTWPPLPSFWYVYAVFLLALFSPLFLLLFRNRKIAWLIIAAMIVLLYANWYSIDIQNGKTYYTGNIKSFFPAYLIGAFYGHIYDESTTQDHIKYIIGFVLVGVFLGYTVYNLLGYMIIAVLPMLMLFFLPIPQWAKGRKLYRLSFLIYATHQAVISLSIERIRHLIFTIVPYVAVANILGRILCILTIIIVNIVIHALMTRFTPKTLNLLTGGRC